MKKKMCALLFALLIAAAGALPAVGALGNAGNFTDVSGHWARDFIVEAYSKGMISGYPDGTFRPSEPLSRAQFTKLAVELFEISGEGSQPFADIDGHWAAPYINKAHAAGILAGVGDRRFAPDEPMSRQDMALCIARIETYIGKVLIETEPEESFADEEYIRVDCREAVGHLRRAGVVGGVGGNLFNPIGQVTRAEALKILLLTWNGLEAAPELTESPVLPSYGA